MNHEQRKQTLETARKYLADHAKTHQKTVGFIVHPTRKGYIAGQIRWYHLDKAGVRAYALPEADPPVGRGMYGDHYYFSREEVLNTVKTLEMIW